MKRKTRKINISLLIGLLIVIVLFTVAFFKISYQKQYVSKNMKISFVQDKESTIEERFGRIIIKQPEGDIVVDSVGTNFEDINGYLNDLQEKNNFILSSKENIKINNYPVVRGEVQKERLYFIYPKKWIVYSLSTDSPQLYDELDQVAKSFKYIGN